MASVSINSPSLKITLETLINLPLIMLYAFTQSLNADLFKLFLRAYSDNFKPDILYFLQYSYLSISV